MRTLGDVGGRELPGKPGLQLDNPTAISMSPFGDLAIGDCRSGGPALNADTADDFVPHQRLLLYNVVPGVVAAVLTEPFKPVDPPGGGKSVNSIRSGDSLPPSIASGKSPVGSGGGGGSLNDGKEDGEEGEGGEEEWFATAPALIPCMCPDGSLLAIHAENSQGWQLDAPKDASKGRGGPFLGRLPPPIVNDIILAHLTYRNAEQARACCRWLHDWTKVRGEELKESGGHFSLTYLSLVRRIAILEECFPQFSSPFWGPRIFGRLLHFTFFHSLRYSCHSVCTTTKQSNRRGGIRGSCGR